MARGVKSSSDGGLGPLLFRNWNPCRQCHAKVVKLELVDHHISDAEGSKRKIILHEAGARYSDL